MTTEIKLERLDVAAATEFGANVNSQSYKAQGVETSMDAVVGRFHASASYTVLDAEVTESLSNSTLQPAFNPAFPDIPIGQFSPLVGQRPFRRPKNLGSMLKEAQKLGFARAILPDAGRAEGTGEAGLSLQSVGSLASLVADIAAQGKTHDRRQPSDGRREKSDDRTPATDARARKADAG